MHKAENMKLTYLSCEAPTKGSASYTHIHEIIKGLEKRNWSVNLYCPSYAAHGRKPSLPLRLIESLRIQIKLWAQWRRGSVLYIRAHYLAFPSALIAKILGVPIFHEINGPYEDIFITYPTLNKAKPVLVGMQKFQYQVATGLIAVTEDLREWAHIQSNKKPTIYISNAANTDIFNANVLPSPNITRKYVIFFGSLAKWHGVDFMIDAANQPQWPKDVDLLFIGNGPEKVKIEEAANLNLLIIYKGPVPHDILPSYIVGAIAGLVPISNPCDRSTTGLNPLKLFETLSCGVPVIVTDFPGQADLVRKNNCGLVINSNEPSSLAEAVKYLYLNPQEAKDMGTRGQDIIRKEYNWDKKADETEKFILSLINGTK